MTPPPPAVPAPRCGPPGTGGGRGSALQVVVVDDNDVWRSSLVTALGSRGITVLYDTANGSALLSALDTLDARTIDVAILDMRLPPTWSDEGIHLARALRGRLGGVGVVILSGYEQDVQLHYATRALAELAAGGGVGYLFKDRTNRRDLSEAVRRVQAGRVVLDTTFAEEAVDAYGLLGTTGDGHHETAVLRLVMRGLERSEIADELNRPVADVGADLSSITRRTAPSALADGSGVVTEGRLSVAVLDWLWRTTPRR